MVDNQSLPDSMLLVVGDGPDRMSLELRAKSLGLASNILWFGQKSSEEVYRLYSIMDIVAVPSVFEGFGLVAAEQWQQAFRLLQQRLTV